MTCPQGSEEDYGLLLDYSAGRLTPVRKAALEAHMAVCQECAAFRDRQAAVWSALDVWDPPPVSPDFNRRLWQQIENPTTAPWHRKLKDALRWRTWQPAFPLAAAAALVVAGFVFDHRAMDAPRERVNSTVAVSSMEAEQVERTLDDLQLLKQLDPASVRPM